MDQQTAHETDGHAHDANSGANGGTAAVATPFDKIGGVLVDEARPRWLALLNSAPVAIALIAIAGVLVFVVNLGGYPLYTKGEPREAVTVFDIVHGGGVILPMRAGVEIPSKPLMMHWLAAIFSLIGGAVNAWTVRMPSALLAIGTLLLCYGYVRRLFDSRTAFFSALILGTSFQFMQAGTGARVDMTLTFFMTLAFFEFVMIAEGLSARTTLMYLAIACAVLTKGPVGLVLPALAAFVWMALWRRWDVLARLNIWHGVLIVGVLAGGWYLAASIVGGSAFVHKQILSENLFRLIGHKGFHEGHVHPFYYMELALMAGFLPWTPVAFLAALQYFRHPRKMDPRLGYVLVWLLAVLVFYNFPRSKRGVYLLALYPALAILVALALGDAIEKRDAIRRWVNAMSRAEGIFFLAAGVLGLLGLAFLFLYPPPIRWLLSLLDIVTAALIPNLASAAAHFIAFAVAIPIALSLIGFSLVRSRARAEKMALGLAAGMICLALAVNLVVVPGLARTLTLRDFAGEAMKIVGTNSVGYLGALDYDFAFYSRRNIPIISLRNDPTEYVLCWRHDYQLIGPKWRQRLQIVLASNPTDLDGSGRMLLLKLNGVPPPASPKSGAGAGRPPSPPAPPAQSKSPHSPPIYSL